MSFGGMNQPKEFKKTSYKKPQGKPNTMLNYVQKPKTGSQTNNNNLNNNHNNNNNTDSSNNPLDKNDEICLHTIGYGGHTSSSTFINILKENEISILVDVRISTYSGLADFNGKNLQSVCNKNKIQYEHFQELGNVFHTLPNHDERVSLYEKLIKQSGELLNVRLLPLVQKSHLKKVAIMCGCKHYTECHRGRISECYYKQILGIRVVHL